MCNGSVYPYVLVFIQRGGGVSTAGLWMWRKVGNSDGKMVVAIILVVVAVVTLLMTI